MLDLFGLSPSVLGLTSSTIQSAELGNRTVYPISLMGMQAGDLAAISKMRISQATGVTLQEHYLTPATQVRGSTWLAFVAQDHIKKRPDFSLNRAKAKLQTFSKLQAVANSHNERCQGTMGPRFEGGVTAARSPEQLTEAANDPAEEAAAAYSSPAKKAKLRYGAGSLVVPVPTAAKGSLGGGQVLAVAKKPKAQAKLKGAARPSRKQSDPAALADAAIEDEAAGKITAADLLQLQTADPVMYEVAVCHHNLAGKPSICFRNVVSFGETNWVNRCMGWSDRG